MGKVRAKGNTRKGFTLLELSVIIFIVGILSAIGLISLIKMIEKSRTAEAKKILGEIRIAERSYYLTDAAYTTDMDLVGQASPTACTSTHFFSYSITAASGIDFTAQATRCSAGGKVPDAPTYNITVDLNGTWSGTAGYF